LEPIGTEIRIGGLEVLENMVARDGIQRHYIGLRLPLTGVRLDPKLDLAA
jgi:hypothetical protein